MKTTPRVITALAIAGAFVTTAVQAAETGPYIRLENGVNSISGASLKLGPVSSAFVGAGRSENIKFKSGYVFGGAVGYRFNESIAAEVEVDHAQNDVDTIGGVGTQALFDQSLKFKQTSLLAGGVYSYKISEPVTLNLGAGLGVQFSSANLEEGSLTVSPGLRLSGKQKSDAAFLAQLKTGVSIALAKNFTFDAGYKLRFVSASDIYEASLSGTVNGSERFTVDAHLNHVFSAGFTFSF